MPPEHVVTSPKRYFALGRRPIRALDIWDGGLGIPATVVYGVYVTATSGTGTRGAFDVTIPYRATHSGTGTLTAYWNSLEDGHPVIEDRVPLTVNR